MEKNIGFGRSISLVYHHYRKFVSLRLNNVENFNPGWIPYGVVSEYLSKRLMVSKPAITKTIQQLESEGLCVVKYHPKDKRSKQIFLTEKANLLLERINPILLSIENEVLEGLTDEELKILDSVFDKILNNISE